MQDIRHWISDRTLRMAHSTGGVRVTTYPRDELRRYLDWKSELATPLPSSAAG